MTFAGLAGAALSISVPAMAGDLLLSKKDANALIQDSVGKPYWSLQAECAGAFGAAYAWEQGQGKAAVAEDDKQIGVSMLDGALARLRIDRGLERAQAMDMALPVVEAGRLAGRNLLDKQGDAPTSNWNAMRSICLDVASAARNHLGT